MRKKLFGVFFLLFHFHLPIAASPRQEASPRQATAQNQQEIGAPYLRNFTPKEYGGGAQNWAIVQDQRGVMYFGNNAGVLEYDGISWRLIPTANRSAVRSLAIGGDGKIYIGARGELGYLSPDSIGQLQYVSLRDSVPDIYRDFADIAKTYATSAGIYFQALDRVLRWSAHGIRVWKPATPFHLSFVVRDRFYVRQPGIGLLQMVGDSLQLAPDGEKFASLRIYFMLPYGENDVLIGTREQGLSLYDGVSVKPFSTEAQAFLLENQIYHGVVLSNGHFALATLRGGVAIIDQTGELQQILNKTSGLQDETVWFLDPDRQSGLWLALNNGISRIEIPSPLSLYDERAGLRGGVEFILRHRGTLYVATGQGVFYLQPQAVAHSEQALIQPSVFQPVEGVASESWFLLSIGEALLAAISDGVYEIQGDKAKLVRKSAGHSFVLHRSKMDTNRIYVGLVDGLASLYAQPLRHGWINEGRINGINEDVRSIVESKDGKLWLGTRSQGFLRVDFSGGFQQNPNVERFDTRHGLPQEHGWVTVISTSERELFLTDKAILKFDRKTNRFIADSTFGKVYALGTKTIGKTVVDYEDNLWMQSGAGRENEIGVTKRQPEGTYVWQLTPFKRFADFIVWSIYPEKDGVTWFGGPSGLVRYDANVNKNYTLNFAALVRRVITVDSDSMIFGGAVGARETAIPLSLSYANNALRFEFSATSYDNNAANQFRYLLEGFDKNWSAWTEENKKDYTNLAEGTYRFHVEAKNIYAHRSAEDIFSFKISAPWYRSWWCYLLYIGALLLSTYGVIKYRTRQLEQRSRTLEKIVQQRTEELRQQADELEKKNAEIIKTQEQLIMQEKLASLGGLTAGIAHEIKNPLNFVNNFAALSVGLTQELKEEIERQKDKVDAQAVEAITEILRDLELNAQKINEHGKRADGIVRSMLMHYRGQEGRREATDINAMLDEDLNLTYHGLRAQDSSFNIKIEKEYDDTIGSIEVLPQELSRVFLNIMNNACYAAHQKKMALGNSFSPTLSVRSKNLGEKIEIRIRDNGAGIPAAIRDKIFNPFFTTKPTGQGTGLGLSISYEIIVQKHKGEVKVETDEGNFTEFIISLPKQWNQKM